MVSSSSIIIVIIIIILFTTTTALFSSPPTFVEAASYSCGGTDPVSSPPVLNLKNIDLSSSPSEAITISGDLDASTSTPCTSISLENISAKSIIFQGSNNNDIKGPISISIIGVTCVLDPAQVQNETFLLNDGVVNIRECIDFLSNFSANENEESPQVTIHGVKLNITYPESVMHYGTQTRLSFGMIRFRRDVDFARLDISHNQLIIKNVNTSYYEPTLNKTLEMVIRLLDFNRVVGANPILFAAKRGQLTISNNTVLISNLTNLYTRRHNIRMAEASQDLRLLSLVFEDNRFDWHCAPSAFYSEDDTTATSKQQNYFENKEQQIQAGLLRFTSKAQISIFRGKGNVLNLVKASENYLIDAVVSFGIEIRKDATSFVIFELSANTQNTIVEGISKDKSSVVMSYIVQALTKFSCSTSFTVQNNSMITGSGVSEIEQMPLSAIVGFFGYSLIAGNFALVNNSIIHLPTTQVGRSVPYHQDHGSIPKNYPDPYPLGAVTVLLYSQDVMALPDGGADQVRSRIVENNVVTVLRGWIGRVMSCFTVFIVQFEKGSDTFAGLDFLSNSILFGDHSFSDILENPRFNGELRRLLPNTKDMERYSSRSDQPNSAFECVQSTRSAIVFLAGAACSSLRSDCLNINIKKNTISVSNSANLSSTDIKLVILGSTIENASSIIIEDNKILTDRLDNSHFRVYGVNIKTSPMNTFVVCSSTVDLRAITAFQLANNLINITFKNISIGTMIGLFHQGGSRTIENVKTLSSDGDRIFVEIMSEGKFPTRESYVSSDEIEITFIGLSITSWYIDGSVLNTNGPIIQNTILKLIADNNSATKDGSFSQIANNRQATLQNAFLIVICYLLANKISGASSVSANGISLRHNIFSSSLNLASRPQVVMTSIMNWGGTTIESLNGIAFVNNTFQSHFIGDNESFNDVVELTPVLLGPANESAKYIDGSGVMISDIVVLEVSENVINWSVSIPWNEQQTLQKGFNLFRSRVPFESFNEITLMKNSATLRVFSANQFGRDDRSQPLPEIEKFSFGKQISIASLEQSIQSCTFFIVQQNSLRTEYIPTTGTETTTTSGSSFLTSNEKIHLISTGGNLTQFTLLSIRQNTIISSHVVSSISIDISIFSSSANIDQIAITQVRANQIIVRKTVSLKAEEEIVIFAPKSAMIHHFHVAGSLTASSSIAMTFSIDDCISDIHFDSSVMNEFYLFLASIANIYVPIVNNNNNNNNNQNSPSRKFTIYNNEVNFTHKFISASNTISLKLTNRILRTTRITMVKNTSNGEMTPIAPSEIDYDDGRFLSEALFKFELKNTNFFATALSAVVYLDNSFFLCSVFCSGLSRINVESVESHLNWTKSTSNGEEEATRIESTLIDLSGDGGYLAEVNCNQAKNIVSFFSNRKIQTGEDVIFVEATSIEMQIVKFVLTTAKIISIDTSTNSFATTQLLLDFDQLSMQTVLLASPNEWFKTLNVSGRSLTVENSGVSFTTELEATLKQFINIGIASIDRSYALSTSEIVGCIVVVDGSSSSDYTNTDTHQNSTVASYIKPMIVDGFFYGYILSASLSAISPLSSSSSSIFSDTVLSISNINMRGRYLDENSITDVKNTFQALLIDESVFFPSTTNNNNNKLIINRRRVYIDSSYLTLENISSTGADSSPKFDDEVSIYVSMIRSSIDNNDKSINLYQSGFSTTVHLFGSLLALTNITAKLKEISMINLNSWVRKENYSKTISTPTLYHDCIVEANDFIIQGTEMFSPGNMTAISFGGNVSSREAGVTFLDNRFEIVVKDNNSNNNHNSDFKTRFSLIGVQNAHHVRTTLAANTNFTIEGTSWTIFFENNETRMNATSGVIIAPIWRILNGIFKNEKNDSEITEMIVSEMEFESVVSNTSWEIGCNHWSRLIDSQFEKYFSDAVAELDFTCSPSKAKELTLTQSKSSLRTTTQTKTLAPAEPHLKNSTVTPPQKVLSKTTSRSLSSSHQPSLSNNDTSPTPSAPQSQSTSNTASPSFSNSFSDSHSEQIIDSRKFWPPSSVPSGITSTTAVVSVLAGFPSAAVFANKLRAMNYLSQCVSNSANGELLGLPELEFDSNPTQMTLGNDEDLDLTEDEENNNGNNNALLLVMKGKFKNFGQYRGSLVANAIIIAGFLLLQAILAFILIKSGRCISFDSAAADVHLPGLAAIVIITFSVPTAVSVGVVASLATTNPNAKSINVILDLIVGIVVYFVIPTMAFYRIAKRLLESKDEKLVKMPKLKRDSNRASATSFFKTLKSDLKYLFDYLLEGFKNWRETNYFRKYGDAFDCCAVPMFIVLDYVIAIFVGLISGLSLVATARSQCLIYAIIVLLACAFHTAAVFILKPMTARFDKWFGVVSSVFSTIAAILALLEVLGIPVNIEEALMYVATLCMIGSAVAFFGSAAPAFKSLKKLMKAQRVARSRRNNKKIEIAAAKKKKEADKEKNKKKNDNRHVDEPMEMEVKRGTSQTTKEKKANSNSNKNNNNQRTSRPSATTTMNLQDLNDDENNDDYQQQHHYNQYHRNQYSSLDQSLLPKPAKNEKRDKKRSESSSSKKKEEAPQSRRRREEEPKKPPHNKRKEERPSPSSSSPAAKAAKSNSSTTRKRRE